MIIGAHIMLQSRDEAADKAFLTNVLKLSSVDAGGGFLIFGLPPAELAMHGSDKNDMHEFFFMCRDVGKFVANMAKHGIEATPPMNQGWGTMTRITLPGGGKLGVYQPHHKRPKHQAAATKKKAPARKVAKKSAKKSAAKKKKAKRR